MVLTHLMPSTLLETNMAVRWLGRSGVSTAMVGEKHFGNFLDNDFDDIVVYDDDQGDNDDIDDNYDVDM